MIVDLDAYMVGCRLWIVGWVAFLTFRIYECFEFTLFYAGLGAAAAFSSSVCHG